MTEKRLLELYLKHSELGEVSFDQFKDAVEKLALNDAAITYQKESSKALGSGFLCGFLGLLHMEITQERLNREFEIDLITTTPSVEYKVGLVTKDLSKVPGLNYALS